MEPEKEELKGNLTRQIAGTGYEIGAGLAFDALTAPLAWTGPVYAAANFGEGAFSNIVGQLIRGEKFNWSEVVSSGALGIVPLSQLRLGKKATNIVGDVNTYRRTIGSGAVTGVADQTIQAGLGEQRLPTTGEVVGGALTGGAVGGLGKRLLHQINNSIPVAYAQGPTRYVQPSLPLQRFQTVSYQRSVINKMSQFGMGDGVFRLKSYDLGKGAKTSTQQRSMLEDYLSPQRLKGSFEGFKKANKPEFQFLWEDFLRSKGLDPVNDIQVHHKNPLYDSIHLFDGVGFNTKEYWDVIETLMKSNARTGSIQRGEAINNLMMTIGKSEWPDTPHGIAHKFLNKFTPTFFSKAELNRMKKDPWYRLKKTKRWAALINKSEQVILEAHEQWMLLNPTTAQRLSFDELVNRLLKFNDLGYNKLIDPEYQLPDMRNIVLEIAKDKKLKGPIFQSRSRPRDLSKATLRDVMTREADIIRERELVDKKLRELRNPKPDPNPGQANLPL